MGLVGSEMCIRDSSGSARRAPSSSGVRYLKLRVLVEVDSLVALDLSLIHI